MAPPVDDPPHPRATPVLIGHARAEAALARALASGRLPHGWLLTGPQGIGKATLAYRFARRLLAAEVAGDGLDFDPRHPVFRLVAQGAHPDLRVVELPRDERGRLKAEIPVDAIRAGTQALRVTAAAGGRRVLVVDGADRLNRNAANALLKMLEEPPAGVVVILVAHRVGAVPATVRSRTAELRLRPLTPAEVADGLARLAGGLAAEEAAALAALAGGSLGRALELRALGAVELYARLLTVAVAGDPVRRLDLAEELARLAEGHGLALVVALLGTMLRRAVDQALGRPPAPALAPEEPDGLARLAAGRPLDRLGALWDNLAGLAGRVEALHLDRTHALVHMLASLTPPAQG